MTASSRVLLAGLIDYAGLFPPARLPLDQALRNYAAYRRGTDSWMLGRFVLPAARLAELAPYHEELFATGPPFAFTVLGRGGATPDEFLAGLEVDLRDVAACRDRHGERVRVDVIETRMPAGIDLRDIAQRTQAAGLFLFGEGHSAVIGQMASVRAAGERIGFKLRCGGLEATAFPTSLHVAEVLRDCRDAGVSFKATAGLHHPLPRFDAGLQVRLHGFINLFLAGALAKARGLPVEQIAGILDDDRAEHFAFAEEGVNWRDVRATTDEIAAGRGEFVVSFGSCSFDEPRDDLRSLGWIDAD